MRSADVVVVGLGVMGAAVLASAARRGLRAVGVERFGVPHALGSSHGGTRVIRKAYYEDPRYVPHLHRSWARWRDLEAALDTRLLVQTGGLHFGPAGHPELAGVLASVAAHDLPHEVLDAAAIARRFPMFVPAAGDVGVLEVEAGALLAERCVAALVEDALAHGAAVQTHEGVSALDLDGADVVVRGAAGAYRAPRVVLALGPWWPEAAPLPAPSPLVVERQVQLWFGGADASALRGLGPEAMPVFLRFGDDLVYGLPHVREAGLLGVKVCGHHGGEATHPERVDRSVRADDEARVRAFLRAHLPAADGPLLGARVCMYTNTPDQHFVVGAHPDDARVYVCAGFSGHGFKLAPSVGELVVQGLVDGVAAPEPLFDPARFRRTHGASGPPRA